MRAEVKYLISPFSRISLVLKTPLNLIMIKTITTVSYVLYTQRSSLSVSLIKSQMYKNSTVYHVEYTHYAHLIFFLFWQEIKLCLMLKVQMLRSFTYLDINLVNQTSLVMFVK